MVIHTFSMWANEQLPATLHSHTKARDNPEIAAKLEADIRRDFHKLMSNQSRIAAKAAGRAVDVSAAPRTPRPSTKMNSGSSCSAG